MNLSRLTSILLIVLALSPSLYAEDFVADNIDVTNDKNLGLVLRSKSLVVFDDSGTVFSKENVIGAFFDEIESKPCLVTCDWNGIVEWYDLVEFKTMKSCSFNFEQYYYQLKTRRNAISSFKKLRHAGWYAFLVRYDSPIVFWNVRTDELMLLDWDANAACGRIVKTRREHLDEGIEKMQSFERAGCNVINLQYTDFSGGNIVLGLEFRDNAYVLEKREFPSLKLLNRVAGRPRVISEDFDYGWILPEKMPVLSLLVRQDLNTENVQPLELEYWKFDEQEQQWAKIRQFTSVHDLSTDIVSETDGKLISFSTKGKDISVVDLESGQIRTMNFEPSDMVPVYVKAVDENILLVCLGKFDGRSKSYRLSKFDVDELVDTEILRCKLDDH